MGSVIGQRLKDLPIRIWIQSMLGKIFKSERSDNNNSQSTTFLTPHPSQQQPPKVPSNKTYPNKLYQVQILQQVSESPPDTPHDNEVQTPGFTDNYEYGDLDLHMSKFEQKTNRMAEFFNNYNEQSEHQSQASSHHPNVEQQNPMILSDSNANFHNTDRLSIMRIRNYVSDLKQVHMDLSEYVQDQKGIIEYFREKICMEAEEFFRNYINTGQHDQQLTKSVTQLKGTVQQQNQQIQRLHRELNESKHELESEQHKNRINNNKNLPCSNCKQLVQKISVQESQIEQRQAYIQSLVAENQSAQQRIFDLEQKIVGIDLEVQKRLKERSKNISERELRARLQNMQSTSNDEDSIRQIEQLKEEIDTLQQKCKRYERTDSRQNELLEKIRKVEEKELQLHHREAAMKESAVQLEEQKYIYSNKQRSILTAEDALAKKKEELNNRQEELSQWQAELAQKEREARHNRDNRVSQQLEEDYYDELNKSKEMSLKSFGANKQYHGFKIQGETFNNTNPVSLKQSLQIPNNYNGKNQEIHHRYPARVEGKSREKLRTEQRQPYNNLVNRDDRIRDVHTIQRQRIVAAHPPKAVERGTGMLMNKKMDLVPSHYRQLREESSFGNLREQNKLTKAGGRIPHQFDLPSSHYRESSKNSRGTSKGVKEKLHHQLSRSGVSLRESTQLTGIGSKLQRLRAQIKKQIDSIK